MKPTYSARPALCVAFALVSLLSSGCDTTHARVPDIQPDEARALVLADLVALQSSPSAATWTRAYRHFDRHVEPHLDAGRRLALEVAFADLRRAVKAGGLDEIRRRAGAIASDLQPQD
jgi:hypothetical protein